MMLSIRVLAIFSIVSLSFFAGCPKEPAAAPLVVERSVVETAKDVSVPVNTPDVVALPDAPSAPEDPPGTLYTWEDDAQNISITQTPPPKGATLIRKELPRVVEKPKSDPGTFGKPSTSPKKVNALEAQDARSAAMAASVISMINDVRADTVAASRHYARLNAKAAPKAVKALNGSRRRLSQLKTDSVLNRNAAGQRAAIQKEAYAKGLSVHITRHLRSREAFDEAFVNSATFQAAVLNAGFTRVGGQCPEGGYSNCFFAFAQSVSRR